MQRCENERKSIFTTKARRTRSEGIRNLLIDFLRALCAFVVKKQYSVIWLWPLGVKSLIGRSMKMSIRNLLAVMALAVVVSFAACSKSGDKSAAATADAET